MSPDTRAAFRFWFAELRRYRFNPIAAMIDYRRERDYFLRWLQQTERALGYSLPPPPDFSPEPPPEPHLA